MGYSANLIFLRECGNDLLPSQPALDLTDTINLFQALKIDNYRAIGTDYFDIHPAELMLASYGNIKLMADQNLLSNCANIEPAGIALTLLERWPAAEMLAIELHSVTNYFAFTYYRQQRLLRALAGEGNELFYEIGEPQPEEWPHYQRSKGIGKQRVFIDNQHEYGYAEYGETLAFAITAKFVGCPLDYWRFEELMAIKYQRLSWWQKLSGH